MGYFYPKNTFLQLNHYMERIYPLYFQLLVHQIPYVIFNNRTPLYFLAHVLHTFDKSSPPWCKFSDFPLLALKLTKFLVSFFKQKVSFYSKFGSFFNVMTHNSSVLFWLKQNILSTKVAICSSHFCS